MRGRTRLFAETYDARHQAQEAGSSEFWLRDYVGRLRLDLIAFRTVVVPDTHLLDGRFFLSITPQTLMGELDRGDLRSRPPLEIPPPFEGFGWLTGCPDHLTRSMSCMDYAAWNKRIDLAPTLNLGHLCR